ncbi:hypothetical protein BDQ94DRAFT_71665 [Aspergillus welwitschiae]|uniref:Uncharacterized protein n=1 Tax=Aspergillus welwitschiae TaxID=1341132 RepID=A0A3F3QFW6_9EURO|nr:hypothetical protein BDQ94DRAFT_71665 [Aspergillus welwitschiae]RDH37950.1 hypothetical protein BDQ94DRAFT_71665 [Aspergillus welwitschiae]
MAWYRIILPFEWSHVDCSGQICPLPCVSCDAVVQIQIYTKVVYFSEGYLETIPVSTQYAGDGMLGERRGRGLGCHRQNRGSWNSLQKGCSMFRTFYLISDREKRLPESIGIAFFCFFALRLGGPI